MLRIENIDLIISKITSKARTAIVTTYFIITKNVIVENDSLINRIPSPRIIISVRSPIATFYVKKSTFITFTEATSFVKKTFFIKTSHDTRSARVIVMNECRSFYINVKNVIVFASFKMKKTYNARH